MKKVCCTKKNLKTSTKPWINIKRMHTITKFNQKAKLKPYIDMKTKSRMQAKMIIKKTSLSQ